MINTERLCPGCMNDNGGEKVCPVCGFDASLENPSEHLPARFTLTERYFVGASKVSNGEGIDYIAWDKSTDLPVNIREYFPEGLARRNPDKTVSAVSEQKYLFNEGLMEFLEINRAVMNAELPSLVKINAVFEENGTAYAVSQHIPSITMEEFLEKNGGTLKWEQARTLFLPLIDTVKGMHDAGFVHGGISAATILVGRDGKLRLSGYGMKKLRLQGTDVKPELFPGYAAIEQYQMQGEVMQTGAYTDVYALCAVLFRVLIGTVPPEATLRIENSTMSIPSKFAEELPRHVLQALANGLQVMPGARTADMETFKNELVYAETEQPKAAAATAGSPSASSHKAKKEGGTVKYVVISAACTAVIFLGIIAALVFTVFREDVFGSGSSAPESSSSDTAPQVDKIGTIDSGAEESAVLFSVPDYRGLYYSEIVADSENDKFEIVIKTKEYNDTYSAGKVCAQSVAAGTGVVRDTTIELIISLGPKEISMPSVLGLDELNASLELLKSGFLYSNIEVLEKYDEDRTPGVVIEQEPKYGAKVNTETSIKIYINSYEGNTVDEPDLFEE